MKKNIKDSTSSKDADSENSRLAEAKRIYDEADRNLRNSNKENRWVIWFLQILKAAQMGLAEAQYEVGVNYRVGIGVKQDAAAAVVWLRRAAEQEYIEAYVELGKTYMYGLGGVKVDGVEAFKWFYLAAEANNPTALYMMGTHYLEKCDEMHAKEAFDYFMRAAKLGEMQAQFEVAVMLYEGEAVAKDMTAAQYWCREAEKQEYDWAMVWHAKRIISGDIEESCAGEVTTLLKRAAELGNEEAEELLNL